MRPASSAAAIVNGFSVEPGSNTSVNARLRIRSRADLVAPVRVVGRQIRERQDRDVVVGVVVHRDEVGLLGLSGHRRCDRVTEVGGQLEHEVVLAVFDPAAGLLGIHHMPVQAAVSGQTVGDLRTRVQLLPGDDGSTVGVDQRHRHLVHVPEGIPIRPQVQRAVHERQQHQHQNRQTRHAAAPETLDLRTECESRQHRQLPPVGMWCSCAGASAPSGLVTPTTTVNRAEIAPSRSTAIARREMSRTCSRSPTTRIGRFDSSANVIRSRNSSRSRQLDDPGLVRGRVDLTEHQIHLGVACLDGHM